MADIVKQRQIFFSCVTVIALIGAAELALRVGGFEPSYKPELLGWRMQLNAQNQPVTDERNQNTFWVNTNVDGLRTSITREKPPQLMRVALMGDSTTFGWGVNDQETIGVQLQEKLRADNPKGQAEVEVLNGAQPGYSTVQVFKIFEDTVQYYKPDWTVIFPPQHDYRPVLVSDWEILKRIKLSRRMAVFLAQYSRIYHALYQFFKGPIETDISESGVTDGIIRVNDDERTEVILSIKNLAQQWGGKVMLAGMLFGDDIQKNALLAEDYPMWNWMQSFHDSHPDIPILDLRLCCHGGTTSYTIPGDPGHLNPQGNERMAECIAQKWHPNKP